MSVGTVERTVGAISGSEKGAMEWQAIPTQYRGVQFRSRFEANAAYLFDVLGLDWEYEPASFLLDDGTHYRPDFWLGEPNMWVECRGYKSEVGERQIRGFGQMIRAGRVEFTGEIRPSTVWNPELLRWENPYHTLAGDYLVLRSGDASEWWEYMGRESATAKPAEATAGLLHCGVCGRWSFLPARRWFECRLCDPGEVRWFDAYTFSDVWIEGSTFQIADLPAPEWKPLGVREWAIKNGLALPGSEIPQL